MNGRPALRAVIVAGHSLLATTVVFAQVATDGSLGAASTLTGPDYHIDASLGRVEGSNLFHSFEHFSLNTGESATFTGPASIDHVISRVTGGTPSSIDGRIQDNFPRAEFYFINPAGVMFGPNASLNVSGSFHISTADYIRLSDGGRFMATTPEEDVTLTSAPPRAFGFLDPSIAPISITGSALNVAGNQQIALVGGDINITRGAWVQAPGGTVQLISSAAAGDIVIESDHLNTEQIADFGEVQVTSASIVDTYAPTGGGDVYIRGGQMIMDGGAIYTNTGGPGDSGDAIIESRHIEMTNGSLISTDSYGGGDGGNVSLLGEDIDINNGSGIYTITHVAGDAGDIAITSNTLAMANGAQVRTQSLSPGNAGNIQLHITDSIGMAAGSVIMANAGNSQVIGLGAAAGDITISTTDMTISDQSALLSRTLGSGNGGTIDINALGDVELARNSAIGAEAIIGGESGDAGNLRINARNLSIYDGAILSTDALGTGASGDIGLDLSGSLTMEGILNIDNQSFNTFISSETTDGTGGTITIRAQDMQLHDAAQIQTATRGLGSGGNIVLDIGDSLLLAGGNPDSPALSGLFSLGLPGSSGPAGNITVTSGTLQILHGAAIWSNAFGSGDGGDIQLAIGDILNLSGTAVKTSPDIPNAGQGGLITTFSTQGSSGDITISAIDIALDDGARLFTNTLGAGSAGDINIHANTVAINGQDKMPTPNTSGIVAETEGRGSGGDINLAVATLRLSDKGRITAASCRAGATHCGQGLAGEITVSATNTIELESGSTISASAQQSDGGNITLNAINRISLQDSQITTSVSTGDGTGGNINIDPEFVTLDNSVIQANAFGGSGGNIAIVAGHFIASPDSIVEAVAKSSTGIDGTVLIQSPDRDISGRLQRPVLTYSSRNPVVVGQCAPSVTGNLIKLQLIPSYSPLTTIPQSLRAPGFATGKGPMTENGKHHYVRDYTAVNNPLACINNH